MRGRPLLRSSCVSPPSLRTLCRASLQPPHSLSFVAACRGPRGDLESRESSALSRHWAAPGPPPPGAGTAGPAPPGGCSPPPGSAESRSCPPGGRRSLLAGSDWSGLTLFYIKDLTTERKSHFSLIAIHESQTLFYSKK